MFSFVGEQVSKSLTKRVQERKRKKHEQQADHNDDNVKGDEGRGMQWMSLKGQPCALGRDCPVSVTG